MHLKAVLRSSDPSDYSVGERATEGLQRRFAPRRSLQLSAVANSPKAGETRVLVRDISPGGILVEAEEHALCVDDSVEVHLEDLGIEQARVVWTSGRYFGCKFNRSISKSAISAALLKAKPPTVELKPVVYESDVFSNKDEIVKIEPKLNFSIAFLLAFALWAVIVMMAYLLTR